MRDPMHRIARRIERLPLADIGFRAPGLSTVALAAALAVLFIWGLGPVLVDIAARGGSLPELAAPLAALPLWLLAANIVVVAAGEEWLYRGYAIERLAAITGSRVLAGVLSLVAFAAAHYPAWGFGMVASTAVSGAILTLCYLWRRDIIALIAAHVATDMWGLVLAPRLSP